MGVLCIYLLIGMLYAFLYGSIDRLGGNPFFASGVAATASRCLYFSFTTMTTVGYGDFTARTNLGTPSRSPRRCWGRSTSSRSWRCWCRTWGDAASAAPEPAGGAPVSPSLRGRHVAQQA